MFLYPQVKIYYFYLYYQPGTFLLIFRPLLYQVSYYHLFSQTFGYFLRQIQVLIFYTIIFLSDINKLSFKLGLLNWSSVCFMINLFLNLNFYFSIELIHFHTSIYFFFS